MRSLKKVLVLISALVFTATAFGQIASYKADPTNYLAVSSQIVAEVELIPGTAEIDIQFFLQDAVNIPTYDPNCLDQIEVQAEYDENNIYLSWSPESTPDHFEIRYFNIDTGDQFLGTTTTSDFTILNVPDGTYIITVNSVCVEQGQPVTTSVSDIIIEDKAVLFVLPDDPVNNDCDCPYETNILSAQSIALTNNLFTGRLDFDPVVGKKYFLKYYLDNVEISKMAMVAIEWGGPTNRIAFEVDCLENLLIIPNRQNWVHAQVLSAPSKGLLHVENPASPIEQYQWYFSLFNNFDQITLSECQENPPGSDDPRKKISHPTDGNLSTNIYPNPASNEVTIHFNTAIEAPRLLTIYNYLGQRIFTKQLELSTTNINIDDYPEGIYNFVISSKGEDLTTTQVINN